MTFENFPSPAETPQPLPPPQKNWRNLLTGGLLVALLGTWGYIVWDKNKTKETIQQKDTVIASTTSQKDELQKELDDATMRYDMIKTSSANMQHSKDSVISKRDREINEKKNKIRLLLAEAGTDKARLVEAGKMIDELKGDIEEYKTKIETLEGEKIVLTREKEDVTLQRDKVRQDFDSAQKAILQKDEMIEIGSTLKASNLNIVGINQKSNGAEKETSTAKRIDEVRITFDLEENRITSTGLKNIYLSISGPDGKPIYTDAASKFKTRNGEEKFYTQKLDVQYAQGKRQTVRFDWKPSQPVQPGDYKIEIYNNGFNIGEGTKTFKKGGLFS